MVPENLPKSTTLNNFVEIIIFFISLFAVNQFPGGSGRVQKLFSWCNCHSSSEHYPLSKFACLSTTLFPVYI